MAQEFEGVYTCTDQDRLDTVMDTIRRSRLHRLIIVDTDGKLQGIVTLGDILQYLLLGDNAGDESTTISGNGSKESVSNDGDST
jgi:5'-AMP-activated protein kinase regulatory gamma subunit